MRRAEQTGSGPTAQRAPAPVPAQQTEGSPDGGRRIGLRPPGPRAQSDELQDRVTSCGAPPGDGVCTSRSAERLQQHLVEPHLPGLAELLDPDRHAFVTGRWLIAVGSQQSIPPRQVETEIAV